MNSESEYQVGQEDSGQEFELSEQQQPRLRPHSRQKNYQAIYKEAKPAVEKRQTRGIHNPLPSELANLGRSEKMEPEFDDEGNLKGSRQEEQGGYEDEDDYSIFNPEIALILWKRIRKGTNQNQYLIKYKGRSYLHTQWLTQGQMDSYGKPMRNKINRFNKNFTKKLQDMAYDDDDLQDGKFFDTSFLEVDRILTATEMFPVIHQKKANQIKGKWSQSLMIVCSKLLNFTKNEIHYGVLFCEPVNPQRDNCSEYLKIIQIPMDLGTILNKVYLDLYKNPQQFWVDIGLVWKNCLKFNKEQNSDLRVLGLTQRQCSIFLYNQWYHLCEERYKKLKQQIKFQQPQQQRVQGENIQEDINILTIDNDGAKLQEIKSNDLISVKEGQVVQEKINIQHKNSENNVAKQEDFQVKDEQQQIKMEQADIKKQNQKNNLKMDVQTKKKDIQEEKSQYVSDSVNQDVPIQENVNAMDLETPHPSRQQQEESEDREFVNMDDFFDKNIFLTQKKVQTPMNAQQLELLNPGEFSYAWLDDQGDGSRFASHSYQYIDFHDMKKLDLNVEVDRLYMIKWKNLSYSEASWELQSVVSCPDKIAEFKQINKALGKEARTLMQSQMEKHKILVDIQFNIKKRARYSNPTIQQYKNKLYFYGVADRKQPHQYQMTNIPVYKNYKILRNYQLDSLNWLIRAWYEKRNTILADEMGLGKTIQSIAFLYHLYTVQNMKGPFLVIAPLSTLQHWKRTVQQWTNLNCVLYYDQNGQVGRRSIQYYQWYHLNITMKGNYLPSQLNKFQILITSYEVFLLDFSSVLINVPFQHIVVDEAHRLKNKNAKILATLKKLPCRRILLLTGTPIQNNTNELWSLLNYIQPDKFSNSDQFKREFGDLSTNEQIEKLNKNLKPFLLRRMKQDVEQSIPPLQQTIIDVQMTNIQKTIYRALFEKNKHMLVKGLSAASSCNTNLNNLEIQLRKCCNHPFLIKQLEADLTKDCNTLQDKIDKLLSASGKMVLVKMLLEKCKAEGKKVLIFSQFTHMLQLIEEFLRFYDYKYQRIDGQIKAKERQAAIDRYNNPDKKRDVFLLSTKAGGIGINLTSANIVIIYDSDWNPQNDVQATARAHRIGQKSEVKVYRLVTCNTYQTEMFQRATQKLGLDKAIFIGGHFKQAGGNSIQGGGPTVQPQNKLSKDEMELLLKKGILGFLENENHEQYFQGNLDEIIQKNSRIAKYSMINGSCSFSKSRFVSDTADNQLKLNDPNFWNIVLKNVESPSQLLLKKVKNLDNYKDIESQKALMVEAAELVNVLIENKLSLSGFNADDEINISEFLTIINSQRQFNKHYRDLASSWLQEICKPSRRFKKLSLQDLTIGKKPLPNKKVNTRANDDENNIFVESNLEEQQQQSLSGQKVKLNDQKRQDYLKRVCFLCQKPKCIYHCTGYCKRAFHEECLRKYEDQNISSIEELGEKFEAKQLCMEPQILKTLLEVNSVCKDCKNNQVACFICKKKGQYYGAQYQKNKKGGKKGNGEGPDQLPVIKGNSKRRNQVTKCSTANCAKFFHPKCIDQYEGKKLFRYIDLNSLHFRCSLHYCNICGVSGDTMSIFQCIRCPKALHIRCMDKQKVIKISKKLFICDCHFKTKKQLKKASERYTAPVAPKKTTAKAQKAQKKRKQKEQISPESEQESELITHNYKTRRNRIPNNTSADVQKQVVEERQRKPTFKNKEKPLLTYEQLGIPPINAFDYTTYDKDWCRYCGSRYSSNFTQGPWGSKTLCTVHYIYWKQNKTLNLDDYPEKPTSPINADSEQELKFLSTYALKNPQIPRQQLIQSLQNRKNKKNH